MNNTCRYRLKCQPEYCYPFHYLCAPYPNPHAGPGVCWGLFYARKDCETTHFSVPIANFVGSIWEVYLYAREEDRDWHLDNANHVPKTRWFPCPDNGDLWDLPLDKQGSLDENDPAWALDPERLVYPTPGP